MGEFKFTQEDVLELRKAHRYPKRSYFTLDGIDIIDGRPFGDWNWTQIYVPRGQKATIAVQLGPDVAEFYKITGLLLKDFGLEDKPFIEFDRVTDTLWLIRDENKGKEEERLGFSVILEPLTGGDSLTVDPIIVNE